MKSIFIIFLRTFLFLTLLIALTELLANDIADIIVGRNVLLPAFLFSIILVLIQVITSSYVGVRDDYSPLQIQTVDGEVDLKILALEIRKATKWVLEIENSTMLRYRSGFDTLRSFGENIIVEKNENKLQITSKPLFNFTLLDYGKNFQNVQLVSKQVSSLLHTTAI